MSELDAMIDALRRLDSEGFGRRIAARATPKLEAALAQSARAGRSPDGQAWKLRKDGGRPLEHAADHLRARAHGALVRVTLEGPDVFHHFGATHGKTRRQVIPDGGAEMPAIVTRALESAAADEFAATVGGAR